MAKISRKSNMNSNDRIDVSLEEPTILTYDGDLILRTSKGEISINQLLARLEALEEAYIEDKLLGKTK